MNYIWQAFAYHPPMSDLPIGLKTKISTGNSGAQVYDMGDKILKIFPERNNQKVFQSGTVLQKRNAYIEKCKYESEMTYIRSIRDIVITTILPDTISPKVYQCGFCKGNNDIKPYILMEKIKGRELYEYKPTGCMKDIHVLLELMKTLKIFNSSLQKTYRRYHKKELPTCHRDLHPHNVFLTPENKIKLIDFDLSICPFDILRTNTMVSRNSLHSPLINSIIQNSIKTTRKYCHQNNVFEYVPSYVKKDADLYQVYSILIYFKYHNKMVYPLIKQLERLTHKKDFIDCSIQILNCLTCNTIIF